MRALVVEDLLPDYAGCVVKDIPPPAPGLWSTTTDTSPEAPRTSTGRTQYKLGRRTGASPSCGGLGAATC